MIEYEMKFKTKHQPILDKIKSLGAEFVKSDYNHDTYFNHPCKEYSKTDEAVRIRKTKSTQKLTYKGPKIGDRSKTREEIEMVVDSDQLQKFLEKLDFVSVEKVRKTRETWICNDYTIVFDTVEELGEYIEVELVREGYESESAIVDILHDFVTKLGLDPNDQILESYLELVLNSH